MIKDFLPHYERLDAQKEIQFLSALIFYLSMVARDSYIPGRYATSGASINDRGKAFNEMIHRASGQLMRCIGGQAASEKETLLGILSDIAENARCKDDVVWAIQESLKQ